MTRREILERGGALVVSFAFSTELTAGREQRAAAPASPPRRSLDPKEVDSFLTIHPDGRITIYTSKVDVGTGMRIAIAQMAAEELGVPTARISIVDGDTGQCPNTGSTGGSTGLTRGGTRAKVQLTPKFQPPKHSNHSLIWGV